MGRSLLAILLAHSAHAAELEVPPLDPESALESIHVPEGFTVDLVAAEPLVLDPVAFDWDTRGRLWVVEMADYPNGMGEGRPAGGRVRLLEDRDRDGTMEHGALFAEGLSFPNGILTWRDGVIVTAAPDVLFLRDTTGDGVADVREVLLTGLTTGNQQLRANGLRWGLDNWVYVAAGGHHGKYGLGTRIRSSRAGAETLVGSRDFRFKPDTGEVEPQSGPSQFGRNRDDWGRWFGTQNIRPLWHYVLPDHYLKRNPHFAAPDGRVLLPGKLNPRVYPAKPPQKRFHSFKEAGGYTSACSGMIYRDRRLFPNGGIQAFACEPFHNLVQRIELQPHGVTFSGRRVGREDEPDFFASSDRWCRPVMVRTGPDGGLWIADMYRYMIEHPQWLPKAGQDELRVHYRSGEDRGRIWRVRRSRDKLVRLPVLEDGDAVALLNSSNGWLRDKAQQVLLWRGGLEAVPKLRELARSKEALGRLHALCTLDGLGELTEEDVLKALADAHPGVRENALRLAETRLTPVVERAVLALESDPNPRVRLQLAFTLGVFGPSEEAATALARMLDASPNDSLVVAAVLSSALPHIRGLVQALGRESTTKLRKQLAEITLSSDERASFAHLLSSSLDDHPATVSLLDIMARHKTSVRDLGNDALTTAFAQRVEAARLVMLDSKAPGDDRIARAHLLSRVSLERQNAIQFLATRIAPDTPPAEFRAVLPILAATADPGVPGILIKAWPGLLPEARSLVLDQLLSRGTWAKSLLEAVSTNAIRPSAFDPARRSRLLKHPDKAIRERATKLLHAETPSPRAEVVAKYQSSLKLKGDKQRGLEVFQKTCLSCHKHGAHGDRDLGPDLLTVAAHPPEKLLANILDPNRDIQPGYHAYNCELRNEEQLFGQVAGETATSITLRLADGSSRAILRSDLVSLRSAEVSLMPEGLEASITKQDMANLITFLRAAQ